VLLRWSGATGSYVDVFLNGARIATTANDGAHRFNVATGLGSYQFVVCEAGTTHCSTTVTVTF
jgi:serine protease